MYDPPEISSDYRYEQRIRIQRREYSESRLKSHLDASNKPEMAVLPPLGMATNSSPEKQKLKDFVFTDPVAFRLSSFSRILILKLNVEDRYLEEDPAIIVRERHGIIEGYRLYLVEQWACSRIHPTFVITTYTGDPDHKAVVGVLGVPMDEESWSQRLRLYFSATSEFYTQTQETSLGLLMVTNLNYFPSTLTIIPVPDGDVERHRYGFLVNENLKRFGCSGRSGMSLAAPAGATQAKFLQLYKTNQRVPLSDAVIELVKLCQFALIAFGKLKQEYADGCLCDVTQIAITEWWNEIGSEYYNTEPSDGILGPTTVAGLLGLLIGARNRLSSYGVPVGKDAFDLHHLKRGIESFQKSQKLMRTRRLDRHTLARLHNVTAKAAAGEGWAVPKAVKSTVAELSGKGGDMVLGIVGRDKAGIGDIETLNIDYFINLAQSQRTKWLWHGKQRRGAPNEPQILNSTRDDSGTHHRSQNKLDTGLPEDEFETRCKAEKSPAAIFGWNPPGPANSVPESPNDRDHLHRTVFKSVSGKMNDARQGFGRIKDAVGFRGNANRQSKDESSTSANSILSSNLSPAFVEPCSPHSGNKICPWKYTPSNYQKMTPKLREPASRSLSQIEGHSSESSHGESQVKNQPDFPSKSSRLDKNMTSVVEQKKNRPDPSPKDLSFTGSIEQVELGKMNFQTQQDQKICDSIIFRRNSISEGANTHKRSRNENWWPRHLSFGDAEDALLCCQTNLEVRDRDKESHFLSLGIKDITENLKRLLDMIMALENEIKPWVEDKLSCIIKIDDQLSIHQDNFHFVYAQLMEQYSILKQSSQKIIASERTHFFEEIRDIEILGAKLEYEINALESKVLDVEDGVILLEKQVDDLEDIANKLDMDLKNESWTRRIVKTLTGIVLGPTISVPVEI
ncbi:putative sin3 complex subunit protein [Golovinomyces cichoracearum]|uniref:Putative sin3 complex subunit protein n=1 Tax=Golovinomyces cichoracearum TaxID=62708 RepID=A0A420IWQ4_9PEZI|nr:putative sin3 complex subunit protein [Golovinomyces cichoracearum]